MRAPSRIVTLPVRQLALALAVVVVLVSPTAASEPLPAELRESLTLYAPFDGHLDVYRRGGMLIAADFRRPGPAHDVELRRHGPGEPRFGPGRVGEALFLESGDYGEFERGTKNLLPRNASTPAGRNEGAFNAVGGAAFAAADGPELADDGAVVVHAERSGQGVETAAAELPQVMRYIGSAWLKGEEPGQRVWLAIEDRTNDYTAQAEVALDTTWRRYHVMLSYDQREGKVDGRELTAPAEAILRVTALEPGTFRAAALMLEQAGIHYANRRSPSTWVPPQQRRANEQLNLPARPGIFDPRAGTIAFWIKLTEAEVNRTLLTVGQGWDRPMRITHNGRLSAYYWDGRMNGPALEPGQWHWLAMTWRDESAELFVDGKSVGTIQANSFEPETFADQVRYILPGNSAGPVRFSPKTHLQGWIEEFAVFDRPLDAEQLRALHEHEGTLVAFEGVMPRLDTPQRVFGRGTGTTPIPVTLRNHTADPVEDVRARFHVDELTAHTSVPVAIEPGDGAALEYPMPVDRLMPGEYALVVEVDAHHGRSGELPVAVGPYRNPQRLPVMAWSGPSGPAGYDELKRIGVTAPPTGTAARSIDWAVERGLTGMAQLRARGEPRSWVADDRILRVDGSRGAPNPASDHVRETVREQGRRFAERLAPLTGVSQVIINSEWHPAIGFNEPLRQTVQEKFGFDMSRWMEENDPGVREPLMPGGNRLNPRVLGEDWFPSQGVVPEDDRFSRFHPWWHRGVGNEVALNQSLGELLGEARPDVARIIEPILRAPPVKRYDAHIDVAQEWFYYEQPRDAVRVQEELATVSRDRPMHPSGMPQFLFKPGTAAPFGSVPPPDMLRQALWLTASRPLRQMSFWGLQHIYHEGDAWVGPETIEQHYGGMDWDEARQARGDGGPDLNPPGVADTMADFADRVWNRLGPLMQQWRNAPRRIAVVHSYAGRLYGDERWPRPGWLSDALNASGMPYDVLYDESFSERPDVLDLYRVVVLPNTPALPERAARSIAHFVREGNPVVVDGRFRVENIERSHRFDEAQVDRAIKMIRDAASLPVRAKSDDTMWNLLELDGAHYLVVVNDRREYGPLLGEWERVREQGVSNEARFHIDSSLNAYAYNLLEADRVEMRTVAGGHELTMPLGPTDGAVIALLSDRPRQLDMALSADNVGRGESLALKFVLHGSDGPIAAAIPLDLTIELPDGATFDVSRTTLLRSGELEVSVEIPHNAPRGEWRVSAREAASGETSEQIIEVR